MPGGSPDWGSGPNAPNINHLAFESAPSDPLPLHHLLVTQIYHLPFQPLKAPSANFAQLTPNKPALCSLCLPQPLLGDCGGPGWLSHRQG